MERASTDPLAPRFAIVDGRQVKDMLRGGEGAIIDLVEAAYSDHGPERMDGLPAGLLPGSGPSPASAVMLLNDVRTGFPLACMEATFVNAAAAGASVALAARELTAHKSIRPERVGYLGLGLNARPVLRYLRSLGWAFVEVGAYDRNLAASESFLAHAEGAGVDARLVRHDRPEDLIQHSDLLVLAGSAPSGQLTQSRWFAHNPLVLDLSLRELPPNVISSGMSVVDEPDQDFPPGTSLHLTEESVGHRMFVHGTLNDVMRGRIAWAGDRPCFFSPLKLENLTHYVAQYVYDRLASADALKTVLGFFDEAVSGGFPEIGGTGAPEWRHSRAPSAGPSRPKTRV